MNAVVQELKASAGPEPYTQDWYEARQDCVTSSKVTSSTPFRRNNYLNGAMERGIVLKNEAILAYSSKRLDNDDQIIRDENGDVFQFGFLTHKNFVRFGGTPNAITKKGILVHLHVASSKKNLLIRTPNKYRRQIQGLLEITGLKRALFVSAYKDEITGWTFKDFRIYRDAKWFAQFKKKYERFITEYDSLKRCLIIED